MALREDQIRRYARHVLLPDVGGVGQARLLAAAVPIDLGDGPAAIVTATYLAAAGVGTLVLGRADRAVTDADVAAGIALGIDDLGRPLGAALAARLTALNPDVTVIAGAAADAPAAERVELAPLPGAALADALIRGGLAACGVVHRIATGQVQP